MIDTEKDAKELRVTGMLHNYLGSDEEVTYLVGKMSRDLVRNQGIYDDVIENMNSYCNNPLHPLSIAIAQAKSTYFSNPWTFLAFLVALLGLLFTAVQTYYAMFPHDNNARTR